MSRAAAPTGDVTSVHLAGARTAAAGQGATSAPGLAGPGSVGDVLRLEDSSREVLEGLLDTARRLRPRLREEQAATEERGTYSPEIHQEFVDAGFFRIMQPKSLGGLELGVEAFYKVITEVGRGCPSTAWCLCLAAGHTLTLSSYWPEEAQRDIFGEHGHIVCPASFNGQQDLTIEYVTVDGVDGLRINGTYKYCSGSPYSTHFMPSFVLPPAEGEDGEPAVHWAVVRRDDYTVLDDWGGIIGMRGSGSNGIHIDDAFVPMHHVVAAPWTSAVEGDTLGSSLHGNPVYAGSFTAFAEGEIAAVTAGLGLAALDEYEAIIASSKAPWTATGQKRAEHPEWQRQFGTVMALVDAAVSLSSHGGLLYEEYARRSALGRESFDGEKSLRLNNLYFVAENQVWEAVDRMLRTAGSRHSASNARLLRYFRDMLTTRTRTDQLDIFAVTTAQAHLGIA